MSELADSNGVSRDRLDSWKAIASHLGRDERTVRRWEKTKGLPVRRVPGGRGHSVFAYVSELDAWLRAAAAETNQPPDSIRVEEPISAGRRLPRWALAAGAAVVVLASLLLVSGTRGDELLSVQLTPQAVIAAGADGKERWRYVPPDDERPFWLHPPQVFRSAPAGVLAATSMRVASMPSLEQGGQLMWFTPQGALARTWELDDRVIYTAERYNAPWVITDVQPMERDNGRLLAVSAHHYTWWPGLLTVLDRDWRRLGTFVNAGWIDQVRWLGSDRLIAAGFSNEYDGGFIALLDLARLSGQSPSNDDGPFKCVSCGDVSPIRYLVFPRSDVNRAGSGTFNRAAVQLLDGKLLVHTIETLTEDQNLAGMTVYELAPDLTPRSAAYSDRYWQEHRALEARGILRHDRAHCPDRDGPKSIETWEPQSGWRTIALR